MFFCGFDKVAKEKKKPYEGSGRGAATAALFGPVGSAYYGSTRSGEGHKVRGAATSAFGTGIGGLIGKKLVSSHARKIQGEIQKALARGADEKAYKHILSRNRKSVALSLLGPTAGSLAGAYAAHKLLEKHHKKD